MAASMDMLALSTQVMALIHSVNIKWLVLLEGQLEGISTLERLIPRTKIGTLPIAGTHVPMQPMKSWGKTSDNTANSKEAEPPPSPPCA
ncbi:hypothetical protein N7486_000492 [Penicillium sp. IBT 16267x]|nr:hypothetical protein N7486_000492 [Penicillium sp. IBT 16267x]